MCPGLFWELEHKVSREKHRPQKEKVGPKKVNLISLVVFLHRLFVHPFPNGLRHAGWEQSKICFSVSLCFGVLGVSEIYPGLEGDVL